MYLDPVVLPEAKPAYEWVRGRALQKASPSRSHSVLQRAFGSMLHNWAAGRGWVGTEWRFIVTPRGGEPRSLVPDVAYVAARRRHKREVYLAAGVTLVLVVDPIRRTVIAAAPNDVLREYTAEQTVASERVPG